MAEEFGYVSSSLVPFTSSIQNNALNPEAPEYYPIQSTPATTTHGRWVTSSTVSSALFHYHQHLNAAACCSSAVVIGQPHRPFSPPSPPPPYHTPSSFYFPGPAPGPISPRLPLDPLNFLVAQPPPLPSPSELIRYETEMMTQELGQALDDEAPVRPIAPASGGASRRWFGRRRGSCYQWGANSSKGADQRGHQVKKLYDEGESSKIVMESGINREDKKSGDENKWRMVSYKSCRRRGIKYGIKPVEKDSKDTTLMIRNIPSRYSRDLMLEFLDLHCMQVNQTLGLTSDHEAIADVGLPPSAYDFFYMPMDFKTGLNKSYAFVNFSTPEAVWRFYTDCDSKKWDHFQSNKIRKIVVAKFQGMDELIDRLGKSIFTCDFDEYLPVCFQPPRDGSAGSLSITTIVGKRDPNHL